MRINMYVRYKNKRADNEFDFYQAHDDRSDVINNYLTNPTVDALRVTFEGVYAGS